MRHLDTVLEKTFLWLHWMLMAKAKESFNGFKSNRIQFDGNMPFNWHKNGHFSSEVFLQPVMENACQAIVLINHH